MEIKDCKTLIVEIKNSSKITTSKFEVMSHKWEPTSSVFFKCRCGAFGLLNKEFRFFKYYVENDIECKYCKDEHDIIDIIE